MQQHRSKGSPREIHPPVPRAEPAARGREEEAGDGVRDPLLDLLSGERDLVELSPPVLLQSTRLVALALGELVDGGIAVGTVVLARVRLVPLLARPAVAGLETGDLLDLSVVVEEYVSSDAREGDEEEEEDEGGGDAVEHVGLQCESGVACSRVCLEEAGVGEGGAVG